MRISCVFESSAGLDLSFCCTSFVGLSVFVLFMVRWGLFGTCLMTSYCLLCLGGYMAGGIF